MATSPDPAGASDAQRLGAPTPAAQTPGILTPDEWRARIAANPTDTEARYGLASALAAAGMPHAAATALDEARLLHGLIYAGQLGADVPRLSRDAEYAAQFALELYRAKHMAAASVIYGRAIAAGDTSLPTLGYYGLALHHQGRLEEAIMVFRAALETYPSSGVHQYMLLPHFGVENGPARLAAEAREWARRWTPQVPEPLLDNPPIEGRKLRIGYVAPTFAGSQLRQFISPVLESHDPEAFSVTLYTSKAESEAGHWPEHLALHPIGHLKDAEAVELIRTDGIDILVDCWGHTAGSRLAMFAHRPAPVQIAWINFIQTTGMDCIDYVLHADGMTRPEELELFTEQVQSIGPIMNPFRPRSGRPAPAPAPSLASGFVTFASFNHPAKLSDDTVRAWSRILSGSPDSRLILKYSYFIDPVLCRATAARFAAEGIALERIQFRGHSDGADYLAAFAEIDLCLDPSPWPGGTTTLEALSMGLPVLTLNDGSFYARIGVQALRAVALPELIATDWDDYVAIALQLSQDVPRLAALRARVRPGFEDGAYRDEVGFTRRLEAVFREMAARKLGEPAKSAAA